MSHKHEWVFFSEYRLLKYSLCRTCGSVLAEAHFNGVDMKPSIMIYTEYAHGRPISELKKYKKVKEGK